MSTRELCELAQSNKWKQIALTDINNTSACLEFIKMAPLYDITPVIGVDFRNTADQQYVGLAKNNEGFRQLNEFLSEHLRLSKKFPETAPSLPDCYFIYPFEKILKQKKEDFKENEYIGISSRSISKLKFSKYRHYSDKLVYLQSVTFRNKKDYNAHRLLRAIDNNTLLSKLAENQQGRLSDKMISSTAVKELFQEFPNIILNTEKILENCRVTFEFGSDQNRNLQVVGKNREYDKLRLKTLCYEKLSQRYPDATAKVHERLEREIKAIIDLGFVSYFLINFEIISYARQMNYPYVGRGSGANSIVAYILGITNVDPIELDLYFERFINPNRKSPPDFDIDFSWKDRNDVTRYIFDSYPNAALMGTYVTFKRRAVARELGKVFGLPKENIDKLSSGYFDFKQLDHLEKLVVRYSKLIEGFPNYLSVHSGGILILNDSVYNYAGTFMPPKGFRTIQIDMNIAEDVGIHKFDILAQRGLPKIRDCIELIKENQPQAYIEDMENIKEIKQDQGVNDLLRKGDCMGVFYIESPAMRGLLTKLQTDNYLNLVAASSVIRPGVSSAGMKEEYIRRHRDPERRKQAHPVLYEIMPDTYGVMVYQEDVMKVAHYFAGLSLDDADVLRRGMSGKKTSKNQMQQIEDVFYKNCREKGYEKSVIEDVWSQISSFAGYAFPKGHSASYAVESYQSLYLKKYFPLEFMVASINNGGGFYNVETYLQEIRRWGGKVHAPCINKSDHPTVIYGKDVFLGFGYIRNLEDRIIRVILENRQFFGEFTSFEDFMDRVSIPLEQLSLLLKINAFRFTNIDKHTLLWKAHFILAGKVPQNLQAVLFKTPHREFDLPEFEWSELTVAYDELELLGFPLCSYFKLLKYPMEPSAVVKDLKNNIGKEVRIYGNLVTIKGTSTSDGKYMFFGTFYDMNGAIFDTVHFPYVAENFTVRSKGIFLCHGRITEEWGYISLTLQWIKKQELNSDPRLTNAF